MKVIDADNIELRWKQVIIGPKAAIKNLELAIKDINWLLEDNRKKQKEIQELGQSFVKIANSLHEEQKG